MPRPSIARSSVVGGFGRQLGGRTRGYTLLELVFASALMATLSGIAVPQVMASLDDLRATGAARYVAAKIQQTRSEAVSRSADVALQFVIGVDGVRFRMYVDANHNGVRTRDIQLGLDVPIGPVERLPDQFSGVEFGVRPNLPGVDSGPPPGTDPIHLGSSNLLSFSPDGTSSTGSLYIKGRRDSQYVIRVFGETGKARTLRFVAASNSWQPL